MFFLNKINYKKYYQHPQADAQRARLHLAPHPLDGLEAQKQLHFLWSAAFSPLPHRFNQGESKALATSRR